MIPRPDGQTESSDSESSKLRRREYWRWHIAAHVAWGTLDLDDLGKSAKDAVALADALIRELEK